METSANLSARAIGAGFFTVFGAAWLMSWALPSFGPARGAASPAVATIALAAVGLMALCVRQYRAHQGELAALADTPHRRRARRVFHIVNALQWIAIMVVVNVLNNVGLASWSVPAVVLIVGLHMFPLAAVFRYKPHHVTGAALVLLALAYPLLSADGPGGLSCRLDAGLILWLSAAWTLSQPLMRARPATAH